MLLDRKTWEERYGGYYRGEAAFQEAMSRHTYLGIGGPADVIVSPADPLSVKNIMLISGQHRIPVLPIGGGSNILVDDAGIEGVVMKFGGFTRIEMIREENDTVELFVEAGVPLQRLISFCRGKGYAGIEGLAGIPGTVGGAICGNSGSFGYEMKDVIASVVLMNEHGALDRRTADALQFRYRGSAIRESDIVLSANLLLRRDEQQAVSSRIDGFLGEKRQKQPIADKSAGCVFRNPEQAPAGRLIEEAGCKGMRIGDAEVSPVHANFFINRGRATSADYGRLMEEVSEIVEKKHGIRLEPEIRIIRRGS